MELADIKNQKNERIEGSSLAKRRERFDITNSEIETLINEWIHNDKHRDILKDRLINGLTFERLSEKYDLSTQQVKNIVYKAMDRLEKHL